MCIGLVDAVPRPKILGNRLGILAFKVDFDSNLSLYLLYIYIYIYIYVCVCVHIYPHDFYIYIYENKCNTYISSSYSSNFKIFKNALGQYTQIALPNMWLLALILNQGVLYVDG